MSDDQAMGAASEQNDTLSWKQVIGELRAGKTIEVPVGNDQEYKRRQRQLERRAERSGLVIEITREVGLLRAKMTGQTTEPLPDRAAKEDRPSREERRARRRAERGQ